MGSQYKDGVNGWQECSYNERIAALSAGVPVRYVAESAGTFTERDYNHCKEIAKTRWQTRKPLEAQIELVIREEQLRIVLALISLPPSALDII